MYLKTTIFTIIAWFIGLILDANIPFGDPMGFLVSHPRDGLMHPA